MMRNKSLFIGLTSLVLAALFLCVASYELSAAPAPGASGYKVIKTVPLGGEGGWDYVYVDSSARRVYISRGTHRSEEHTSELQSPMYLVCRLLLEKKKNKKNIKIKRKI